MEDFLRYGDLISFSHMDEGHLASKGFIDTSIVLKDLQEQDFFPGVFRVFPQSIHSVQTEFLSLLNNFSIESLNEIISKLRESIEGEIKTNIQIYNNFKLQPIKYGSLIQLQHVASGKFLSVFPLENAEFERDNIKLGLSEFFSNNSLIRIHPTYKFQVEGSSWVQYKDQVHLEITLPNINKSSYIHISSGNSEAKEINCSLDVKTKWKINLYSSLQDTDCLLCGDYIWLTHSELKLLLINSKVLKFTDSINDTNGIWKIESEFQAYADIVKTNEPYRIKNLSTGQYLTIKTEYRKGKTKEKLFMTSIKDVRSLWKFIHMYKKKKYVNKNDICMIANCETGGLIDGILNKDFPIINNTSENAYFKVFRCEDSIIRRALLVMNCTQPLNSYLGYIECLDIENLEKKSYYKVSNSVIKCLEQLDQYCKNKLIATIEFQQQFGQILSSRQKLLKEQKFIELLTEILRKLNINDIYPNTLKDTPYTEIYAKMVEIAKTIYRILIMVCKKNPDNQSLAYKFIDIYKLHANYLEITTEFIIAIFQNNSALLYSISKPPCSLIQHYISLLNTNFQSKKPHLMNFLQFICLDHGAGIKLTQEKIHECLFEGPDSSNKGIITTVAEGNKIQLVIPKLINEEVIPFEKFFIDQESDQNVKLNLEYFNKMLELFANLCKDRNYTCKSAVNNWFPAEVLNHYIKNNEISIELRASFVRLTFSTYIDSHPRHENNYPESVKVLKLLDKENPVKNYKKMFSIMDLDVSVDSVRTRVRKYTQAKPGKFKKEITDVVFEKDEIVLFQIKEDLISYAHKMELSLEHNVFTYEIILAASQLVKFGIISNVCTIPDSYTAVMDPLDPRFSYENTDLSKLLKSLIVLLITNKHETEEMIKLKTLKTEKNIKKEKPDPSDIGSKIFETKEASPMIETLKNTTNYFKSALKVDPDDDDYETKCKIKICELLTYILRWRQDYLLNNIIEWFNSDSNKQNSDEYFLLLPDTPFGKTRNFKQYTQPEIKDLHFYNPRIMPSLFKQFVHANSYELKSLTLLVLFTCFSMRKILLKCLDKIQIITSIKISEALVWVKKKTEVIQQIGEQSEIWLDYWNQSSSNKEASIEKIEMLQAAIEDIKKSLRVDSAINYGELEPGTSSAYNPSLQIIYTNILIHENIIELIQDSMQTLSELYTSTSSPPEPLSRFTSLFQSCYSLLVALVYKNSKIQKILHKYQDIFISYIYIPIGQIELLCSIYDGNLTLCKTINEEFLNVFIELIRDYGRRAEYLNIFGVIQVFGEDFLPENQRLVVKLLLGGNYKYNCYMTSDKANVFSVEIQENKNKNALVCKDEVFVYHAKLISVLSQSSHGSSGVYMTEMKCQKLLSIEYIFELLEKSEDPGYSILFIPLLDFFYHVYIDTEKINDSVINSPHLKKFITGQIEYLESKYELTDYDIQVIELIVLILHKYNSMYCVGDIFDFIYENIRSYLSILCQKYEVVLETRISSKILEKIESLSIKYDIEFNMNILNEYNQTDFKVTDNLVKTEWEEFKNNIQHTKTLKSYLNEEKSEFIDMILNISKLCPGESTKSIFVSILGYIEDYSYHKPKVSLLNKLIKFLAYFFSHCEETEEFLKDLKNELNDRGIVNTIMALLCDTMTSKKTFLDLINLSCALLDNGDSQIQNSFYSYFTSNPGSHVFFKRLDNYLIQYTLTSKGFWSKNIPIYKHKIDDCRLTLRFLQLLCENHNLNLQDYLRHQHKSRHSYNLVTSLVILLEDLLKKCHEYHFHIITQCFDTLTELIQGPCKGNQIAIIDSKFLEIASRLLSFDEKSDSMSKYKLLKEDVISTIGSRDELSGNCLKGWMIADIKYKCLITLLSLLEAQTGNYVITRMIRSLSLEILKENIISFYYSYTELYPEGYYEHDVFDHHSENYKYSPKREKKYEDKAEYYQLIIEVGFMVYHLMCHFKDNDDPDNKRIVRNELPDLLVNEENSSFFGTKLIGDLGKFGLSLLKSGFSAVNNIIRKKRLKTGVTEVEKHRILLSAYAFFQKHTGNIEIIYKKDIFRIYFWIRPEGHHISLEQKKNFHFYVDRSSDKAKIQYLLLKSNDIIEEMAHEFVLDKLLNKYKIIGLVAANITVWKELAFIMTIAINFIIIASFYNDGSVPGTPSFWYDGSNQSISYSLINVFGSIQLACSVCIVALFQLKAAPILVSRGWRARGNHNSSNLIMASYGKAKNALLTLYFVLSDINVLYQLGYLAFSILGTGYSPLFFSFHLLDILYKYPALQSVIQSILLPRKSLFLSFILILIITYLYAIWYYFSYYEYFNGDCDNLLLCYKTMFDEGLKCGGAIGDYLNQLYLAVNNIGRFFGDAICYIILIQIMLNILSGIIIDTFGILRERNNRDDEDIEKKCFICSCDKEFIEYYTNRPFKFHTTYEHNEWNYVLFINYLRAKDSSERTGMESYLIELIDKNETSWIPQHRSLSIANRAEQEENIAKKKLTDIETVYNILEREIKDVKKSFNYYLETKHILS